MGVRIKKNNLPKIIRQLPRELDIEVDRFGDEVAPAIWAKVRHATGVSANTTKNRTAGTLHTAIGIGIHEGTGFYIRFYEWGTSSPNAYGNLVPAELNVTETAAAYTPVLVGRMTQAIRRAVQ